ncbi:MAG: N-acetylmuramoyl-L-alanine amidase [Methylacidiphilales bacterium]|nr:N-acetylmuramoyl-L-alanine amidase [Candidatus Methylacidiphilales bacterium]
MTKACLALAFFCLFFVLPLRAFDWETATVNGRDYVTLRSFCTFYGFYYEVPGGDYFTSRSTAHSLRFKLGNSDIYIDGVHYVLSLPIESGDHDWLVSRMDVIKLFDPILRPTEASDRHTIRGVVIDPGHGGTDNGAASSLGYEKTYTLETAFILEGILRAAGLKTVLTRRTDVFVDLYERAHIASLYPDYAFVSIHYNSATPEAHGLETYCLAPRGAASSSSAYLSRADIYKLPGNDTDALNILLASCVHSEIIRLNPGDPSADRGVKRARFVVIKQNILPAILVEGGFVSNHMEARRIDREDYRQRLAEAIARGIIRFVNVMGDRNIPLPEETAPAPKPVPVAPPAPSGLASESMYGAFPKPSPVSTSTASHKPKKKKPITTNGTPSNAPNTVQTPVPANPTQSASARSSTTPPPAPASSTSTPPPAATPAETATAPVGGIKPANATPSGPLNLNEPVSPAPTSVSDKPAASAEPDEPPTVSIYPTAQATNAATPTTPPSTSQP